MNKAQLGQWWDHFRTVNGITLRAIKAIPKDKIDSKPCKDMRTPKELIAHMYTSMKGVADGITKGNVVYAPGEPDKTAEAGIKSHDELVKYATESWNATDRSIRSLGDDKISGTVKTPWGEMPGFVCVQIIYDEHLHHRGQLYAYLRQFGVEPPMMWDFEHNAPEFQEKAAAQKA
jgi:uncharacterized damage-inducible protein DinB